MCDPISIGLMVASTAMKYIGNKQAERATKNRLLAEEQRQQSMTKQQDAALDESMQSATRLKDPNAQNEATGRRREAFIAALNQRPDSQNYLPGQDSAPQVVADAAGRAGGASEAFSANQAGALAALTGQDDLLQRTQIDMGRRGQDIGQISRNKFNSANALSAELRAAQYKGQFLRGLGDLVGAVGMGKATGGGGGSIDNVSTGSTI